MLETHDRRSDAELVEEARAGKQEAFGALVDRYRGLIAAMAYARLANVGGGEEVAQETFVVAWDRLSALRRPELFRRWLCGILKHVCRRWRFQHLRRRSLRTDSRGEGPQIASVEPSPLDRIISQEEQSLLNRALGTLPEAYRVTLVLYYQEQHSIDRVAAMLDLRVTTVRDRLKVGRKMLQEHLSGVERILTTKSRRKEFTAAVLAAISATAGKTADAVPKPRLSPKSVILVMGTVVVLVAGLSVGSMSVLGKARSRRSSPAKAAAGLAGQSPPGAQAAVGVPSLRDLAALDPKRPNAPTTGDVLDFDFEDGILPAIFSTGHLVPTSGRPSSRYSVMATMRPEWLKNVEVIVGEVMEKGATLFRYSETMVVSFDYWTGENEPVVRFTVYDNDRRGNYDLTGDGLLGVWAHAVVRLRDFAESPPMVEGDSIRFLSIGGFYGVGSKPLLVDNLKVIEYPASELPSSSTFKGAIRP